METQDTVGSVSVRSSLKQKKKQQQQEEARMPHMDRHNRSGNLPGMKSGKGNGQQMDRVETSNSASEVKLRTRIYETPEKEGSKSSKTTSEVKGANPLRKRSEEQPNRANGGAKQPPAEKNPNHREQIKRLPARPHQRSDQRAHKKRSHNRRATAARTWKAAGRRAEEARWGGEALLRRRALELKWREQRAAASRSGVGRGRTQAGGQSVVRRDGG
jgi:hypothetical protein